MTLMRGRDGRGCDARCHAAQGDACRCVCGGRHHGIGRARASLYEASGRLDAAASVPGTAAGLRQLVALRAGRACRHVGEAAHGPDPSGCVPGTEDGLRALLALRSKRHGREASG